MLPLFPKCVKFSKLLQYIQAKLNCQKQCFLFLIPIIFKTSIFDICSVHVILNICWVELSVASNLQLWRKLSSILDNHLLDTHTRSVSSTRLYMVTTEIKSTRHCCWVSRSNSFFFFYGMTMFPPTNRFASYIHIRIYKI